MYPPGHRDSSSTQEYDKSNTLYYYTICIAIFDTELIVIVQSYYSEEIYIQVG